MTPDSRAVPGRGGGEAAEDGRSGGQGLLDRVPGQRTPARRTENVRGLVLRVLGCAAAARAVLESVREQSGSRRRERSPEPGARVVFFPLPNVPAGKGGTGPATATGGLARQVAREGSLFRWTAFNHQYTKAELDPFRGPSQLGIRGFAHVCEHGAVCLAARALTCLLGYEAMNCLWRMSSVEQH